MSESRPRVLVLEDRAQDRLYLTTLLGYRRFVVTEAANGEEGLAAVAAGTFDLIISDVLMPKVDGYEFVRRLRRTKQGADIPVLFYTATYHERDARTLADECGVVDVLIKPSEPEALLAKIDSVLARGRVPVVAIADEPFERQHALLTSDTLIQKLRELEDIERRMAALVHIGQRLTEEHDPVTLLNLVCSTVRETTLAKYAIVALVSEDKKRFSMAMTSGYDEPIVDRLRALVELPPPTVKVIDDRRPLRGRTPHGVPVHWTWHPPFSAYMVVPLASRDRVLGVVIVAEKIGAPEFSDADETLASTLGVQAGIAYENARLINELESAAAALREREATTEFALAAAGVGIFERNLTTNQIGQSAGLRGLFKLPESPTRDDLFEVVDPEDWPRGRETIDQAIRDRAGFKFDFKGTLHDGRAGHFHARGRIDTDTHGVPTRLVSVVIDMTERRALEAQLRQSQKMEAIGQLASGVAHDFNNLLTVIQGYSRFLIESARDDDQRRDATAISEAGDRAAALTRQLLTFSRNQAREISIFDLNSLITDLADMLTRLIGEHIRLTTVLGDSLGTLNEDRGQIGQLIMNLVVNARDAMPSGGEVRIETSVATDDDREWVRLAISDTGTGISDAVKSRLFEPFFTTKEAGKGTGLGLATVAGIVQQSEGRITVDSVIGEGSTFTILLPRHDSVASLPIADDTHLVTGTESILVVEDDAAIRALTQQVLERSGYHVTTAANRAEAIAAGRQDAFALVISDVLLPDGIGPDLFVQLSAAQPGLRVLYASGYAPETTLDIRKLDDRAGFLAKPFTPEALTRKVREVLDR